MRKTYRYKNLSYTVADDASAELTLEYISNGNSAVTVINIPGDDDPEIDGEGTVSLGMGEDLRAHPTVVFSDVINPAEGEDEVRLRYLINGELLQEHANPRSEEERPIIVLIITFDAP